VIEQQKNRRLLAMKYIGLLRGHGITIASELSKEGTIYAETKSKYRLTV